MTALAAARPSRIRPLTRVSLLAAVPFLVAAAWLAWRFYAPVEVHIVGQAVGVPFTIETIPAVVSARPGEMVSVIYRIRNTQLMPVTAIGRIAVDPASDAGQMQIFLTQCGGLNTYQAAYAQDYQVIFRVQPAGLTGSQELTLRHVFTRSTPEQ